MTTCCQLSRQVGKGRWFVTRVLPLGTGCCRCESVLCTARSSNSTLKPQPLLLLCCCCCRCPQHYRRSQDAFTFGIDKKKISLADILVAGAAAAIKQCSGNVLNIPYTYGRSDAEQADDAPLPSPQSIVEDAHFSVFQTMVSSRAGPCNTASQQATACPQGCDTTI